MKIEWIANQILGGDYIYSCHADQERRNDSFSVTEIEEVLTHGEIIEDYPDDPRGPSCLVCGEAGQRSVHVVCGTNSIDKLFIITIYGPRPPKWPTPRERYRK